MHVKAKIHKWDLIKLISFCIAMETIKKMKRQYMEWEKIFANNVTDKGFIFKIYKQLLQLNNKAKQNRNKRQPNWKMGSSPKYTFSKEDIQNVNRHMKRFPSLLTVREIQIKITMKYYLIPVRMIIIKKSTNSKCWRGCGEKRTLLHCWWECNLVQPLWKTVWRFLKN